MKKLTIFILSIILMVSSIGCSQSDVDQSSQPHSNEENEIGDAVEISTEEQLFAIGNNLSGKYILKNDITLTRQWNALGSADNPFEGILDGNGFTIYNMELASNLVSVDDTSIEYMVGMFGVLSGTVRNLNINPLLVNIDSSKIAQTDYMSLKSSNPQVTDFDIHIGFVGLNKGNIRNVTVNADYTVIPDCETSRIRIGGIAGKSNDEITDCTVNGEIKTQNRDGYIRAGGVAGYVSSNGIIQKSRANIHILAEITTEAKMNLGGLIGNLQCGTITNCISTGTIEGINTENKITVSGGLIGLIDNCDTKYEDMSVTVDNCYSTTDVISQGAKGYASGFIGQIDFGNKVTITNNSCSGKSQGQKSSFGFIGRIQTPDGTKLGASDFTNGNYNDIVTIADNKSVVADVFATQTNEIVLP